MVITKVPEFTFGGFPVTGVQVTHGVMGGSAVVHLSTGREPWNGSLGGPVWRKAPEGEQTLSWDGKPLFKGFVGNVTREAKRDSAAFSVSLKPLINKLSEGGVLSTSIIRTSDSVQSDEAGTTQKKSDAPSINREVGHYKKDEDICEWVIKLATFLAVDGDAPSVLTIVRPCVPKYPLHKTLSQGVIKNFKSRFRLNDTCLNYIAGLLPTLAVTMVSYPSLGGKWGLIPYFPLAKKPVATLTTDQQISISDTSEVSIFPDITMWSPRLPRNVKGEDKESPNQKAFTAGVKANFHIYKEGGGIDWMVPRSPVFGYLTALDLEEANNLGNASVRIQWGEKMYSGRTVRVSVPWSEYWGLSKAIGGCVKINLPKGFQGDGGSVYGYLQSITLEARAGVGQGGSSVNVTAMLTHVRSEEENNEHGFDEHPLYKDTGGSA